MTPFIQRLAGFRERGASASGVTADHPARPIGRIVLGVGLAALGVGAVIATAWERPDADRVAPVPAPATRPAAPAPSIPEIEPPPVPVVLCVEPRAEDFRPEYDRDAANRGVQGWDTYWGWVETYYRGNFLAGGWAAEARASVDRVADPAARRELTATLNDLGRLASREWAKDRGVRRITTDDVKTWGRRLDQARRDEVGTGATLLPVLRAIRAEAEAKLAPKGGP